LGVRGETNANVRVQKKRGQADRLLPGPCPALARFSASASYRLSKQPLPSKEADATKAIFIAAMKTGAIGLAIQEGVPETESVSSHRVLESERTVAVGPLPAESITAPERESVTIAVPLRHPDYHSAVVESMVVEPIAVVAVRISVVSILAETRRLSQRRRAER